MTSNPEKAALVSTMLMFGVIFVMLLMIFIIYTGIKSLTDTEFSLGSYEDSMKTNWETN